MTTHYELLGINKSASFEVIKSAYKSMTQKWHPDKNPATREKAEEQFKIIANAYTALSDPASRASYDAWLVLNKIVVPEKKVDVAFDEDIRVTPDIWSSYMSAMREELAEQQFNTWIRPLQACLSGGKWCIYAPNRFVKDWVIEKYLGRLRDLVDQRGDGSGFQLAIHIGCAPRN